MDFFSIRTAFIPLSFYLFFLGVMNLSRKTRVLTGRQDLIALSFGVAGLVIVGPLQIFLPPAGMIRFGNHIWYPVVVLYLFGVLWLSMICRQRLIFYNLKYDAFSRIFERVTEREIWTVQRHGDVVQISELKIQFEILVAEAVKNITLRATRGEQSSAGWNALQNAIRDELLSHYTVPSVYGWIYVASGIVVAAVGWTSISMA
ncbi:MAG: hypothetical protein VX970_03870 [Planctomycetota bacterium]|nr:hypothetical protein [Planctomycetota bacterium]